ncbi:substrate-binding domain-containing protein [Nodosilinea sp. P-1105]|uniref:substrate-binding domain-containing protein n=1 Tax=Nodosilinea sp. P-1105 TaxID=2546229 RepID=UPI00146D2253|nr:substrate-binding domain-containing protein [Nodosilinea sp. P-1105]NMF85912.1 DUF4912 domain-containing protein [Nodosilinea sp. P-1105]
MDKLLKPSLVLLALFSALATLPVQTLRSDQGWLAQGQGNEDVPTFVAPQTVAPGTIVTIDGTPSMAGINQVMGRQFEQQFPDTQVVATTNGDTAALEALRAGTVDLAALGRSLTDQELAQNLTEVPVTREKIAIIVGRDNPFRGDLTFGDFARIFRGEITNWAELGGPNLPIRFIDRPVDSDIRRALADYDVFRQQPFETGPTAVSMETDDTAAIVRELGNDGMSYAIASEVVDQPAIRLVTMHNTLPDDPRYPYSQPRNYVYLGEPSLAVAAFLGFATNPDGQAAVAAAQQIASDNVTAGSSQLPGGVALAPDAQFMVRGSETGDLQWLDAEGNPTDTVVEAAHQGLVSAVVVSPDGQTVVSSGADGTLRRWDRNGNPLGEPMDGAGGPILALALSPDGQTIISGNADGTVERWSTADGSVIGEPIAAHDQAVQAVYVPAGGQNFLSGSSDGSLGFWNADGSAADSVVNAHPGGITQVVSSPDGQVFTTAGEDGTLRQWDRATLQPRGETIAAHPEAVSAIAYSPDGETIATAGRDGTLQLWGPDASDRLPEPITLDAPASSLGFTPAGQLVVGTADNRVELRDAQGQLLSEAEQVEPGPDADQTAMPAEWSEFVNRLRNLPTNVWWVLALIPALLILAGIIGSLLGIKSKHDEEDVDDEVNTATGAGLGINFGAVGDGSSAVAGLPPEAGLISPEEVDQDRERPNQLGQARLDLAEGRRLMAAGQYNRALIYFTSAVDAAHAERAHAEATGGPMGGINAISAQAKAQRGHAFTALNQVNEAMDSYNAALALDASVIEAWIGKGHLLNRLGRYEEALFCFDTAIEMDSAMADAWQGKGQALIAMGRQAEGQDCLDRAMALGGDAATVVSGAQGTGLTITPGPGSAFKDGGDVPPDLEQMILRLPSEDGAVTTASLDPAGVPPELAAQVATLPSEPEYAPEHALEYAPESNPDPSAVGADPPVSTSELAGLAPSPLEDELLHQVHLSAVSPQDDVESISPQPTPAPSSPRGTITPGPAVDAPAPDPIPGPPEVPFDPLDFVPPPHEAAPDLARADGSSLEALPPEVLAAMASIPPGSPDSFEAVGLAPESAPESAPEAVSARSSWLRLTLDPENPQRFYAVWHLDDRDRAEAKHQGGDILAVRLYDVTGQGSDAPLGDPVEEQRCGDDFAQDWYLPIPQPDRIYLATVGYFSTTGDWIAIAQSKEVAAIAQPN